MNRDNGQVLAKDVQLADRFFARLRGLMFSKALPPMSCLYLQPCRAVHTYFMNYAIDVLHLDDKHCIVGIVHEMKPGLVGKNIPGTTSVVEFSAGTLREAQCEVGQAVQFIKKL